eukprot:1155977-Pelagomonas_calceolata.AAC.4
MQHCSILSTKATLPTSTRYSPNTTKASARHDNRLSPTPQESQHQAGPHVQLAEGGRYLQVSGSSVSLSRVISPVQPVRSVSEGDRSVACSCGYTLVTVQRAGTRSRSPTYRVVGAHTCGRGVPVPGKRCKHHKGAAHFEVWRVRQVAGTGGGGAGVQGPSVQPLRQAMLLFSCNSLQQLECFFGLHLSNQKLQMMAFSCLSVLKQAKKELGPLYSSSAPHIPTRALVQLVDHWGALGGMMEHHLVRPGLPLQPNAEEPLPAWKRWDVFSASRRLLFIHPEE